MLPDKIISVAQTQLPCHMKIRQQMTSKLTIVNSISFQDVLSGVIDLLTTELVDGMSWQGGGCRLK
jgi:hypothetical protein